MSLFSNWSKNILFLLVYMLSGLILVLIIEGLLTGTELIPFNTAIESVMTGIRVPILTTLIVTVTNVASPFVFTCLALFIVVVLMMRGETYDAAFFALSIVVSLICFTVLKNIFQVPRPSSAILQENGWSFPSGHATVATSFFFLLALCFFSSMWSTKKKVLFISACVTGTLLVCFSRLYLGAHWALDVLAGIAVGLLCVSFVALVFGVLFGDVHWLRRRSRL